MTVRSLGGLLGLLRALRVAHRAAPAARLLLLLGALLGALRQQAGVLGRLHVALLDAALLERGAVPLALRAGTARSAGRITAL